MEAQEFNLKIRTDDNSLPENSKIQQWHDKFHEGMMMAGCNLSQSSQDVKGYMEEAGFVNVEVIDLKFPIAPWPKEKRLKEAGAYAMLSMMEDITGMSLAVFTRLLAWDRIELELFLADVRAEWKMKGVHAYWPLWVALFSLFYLILGMPWGKVIGRLNLTNVWGVGFRFMGKDHLRRRMKRRWRLRQDRGQLSRSQEQLQALVK